MKTKAIYHTKTKVDHIFEPIHFKESTDPFAKTMDARATASAKTGKRPRILKPLYSVRLS